VSVAADEWAPDEEPDTGITSFPRAFNLTDLGNAERLVAHYRDRIRYSGQRRKWLLWDGTRWRWDETFAIERMAKRAVRRIRDEAALLEGKEAARVFQFSLQSESAKAIKALTGLAQSEAGVPVMMVDLDADPWLLNCSNGTVDLRTGEQRPHNRADLITRCTGVEYLPGAKSELWAKVLHDATGGDAELATYLQRVAGYSLIGLPLERVFFFLYGPPGTAKSTLIEALHAAMGDYAQDASFDTWLVQERTGGNRGDLVRIAGARLVTSVEVKPGAKWDEALLKRITGGDQLTAAAKYENDVSFRPSCSLLFAANDSPIAREDDEGFWARMRRIPLVAKIPLEQQDKTLKLKLREPENARAILSWAILGCVAYMEHGLGQSRAVTDSTAEYRQELDHFSEFLSDCYVLEEGGSVTRSELRTRYEMWGKEVNRKFLLTSKQIAEKLRARDCTEKSTGGKRLWFGIRERLPMDGES
jgi:putative DNA primase/helicase